MTGVTGSGKSVVARHFSDRATVLHVDLVQRVAGDVLAGDSDSEDVWSWEWWRSRMDQPNFAEAIRSGLIELNPKLDVKTVSCLIAEGTILGLAMWRNAFISALRDFGVVPVATTLIWLDPPPRVLMEQIIQRGRQNQRDYTLDRAERSQAWFVREADIEGAIRLQSPDEVSRVIDEFFANSSPHPNL